MTRIKEFRIPMPFIPSEFQRGQRYAISRLSNESTNTNDGIELVCQKNFVDEKSGNQGIFTHKIYYLGGYVPTWVKAIMPTSAMRLEEKAHDCFPWCKTTLTSPFLGERFEITIETRCVEKDRGEKENIFELSSKELKKREVEILDIGTSKYAEYKSVNKAEEPCLIGSQKAKMEPLAPDWLKKSNLPIMCCYKLVKIRCKIFGLQTKAENYLVGMERDVFLRVHRLIFCWLEDWFELSLEQVLEAEKKFLTEMTEKINKGSEQRKKQEEDAKSFKVDEKQIAEAQNTLDNEGPSSPPDSPKQETK